MPVPFSKPATSVPDQIALLKNRGLIIEDSQVAEHYLLHVGYYRLAGYWQIFQNDRINHTFNKDATIEGVIDLYNFDRELRLLLLDAIERIEVSFRALLSNIMCCRYGPVWYAEPQFAYSLNVFDSILGTIGKELDRSSEDVNLQPTPCFYFDFS